ncbi:tol-pal system protein YbgF [Halomonas denitrificans]|nr:tol-pal system protein YbgF [Halomonas denitrificans]
MTTSARPAFTKPAPAVAIVAMTAIAASLFLAPATSPAQDDSLASRYILELQQMREELRELRGLVETQAQEIENLKRRQRDQYLDLDRRIGELAASGTGGPATGGPGRESSAIDARATPAGPADDRTERGAGTATGAAAPSTVADQPSIEAPPPPSDLPAVREPIEAEAQIATLEAQSSGGARELEPPTEVEQQAYDQAFLALRETRYADAAEGFDRFLRDHPQSSYAPNALYWLGEVYYVTRDFETALAQFRNLLDRYPGSGKQPDALLKTGFSHYELGHWPEARAALQQVVEQYPGTNYARLAENRLRTMRLEGRL